MEISGSGKVLLEALGSALVVLTAGWMIRTRVAAAFRRRHRHQSGGRIAALDGLRGIAIALVVVRHYAPNGFPGGGIVGVDLFFVLSGFLITGLLLGEGTSVGRISLGRFYARRALRLYPALYAMLAGYLVLVAVAGGRVGAPLRQAAVGAAFASLYVYNLAVAAHVRLPDELGPLWTLSVEEQFYVLWPLALIVLSRAKPRTMAAIVVAAIAALWIIRALLFFRFGAASVYNLTSTWADALLAGSFLAITRHYNLFPRLRQSLSRSSVAAASGLVLLGAVFVPNLKGLGATYTLGLPVFCVALAATVCYAVDHPHTLSAKTLRLRSLVTLGALSYSLYLYNYLVRDLIMQSGRGPAIALVIGIPLAVSFAALSRSLVERPALRLKRRFESKRRPPDTVAAQVADTAVVVSAPA